MDGSRLKLVGGLIIIAATCALVAMADEVCRDDAVCSCDEDGCFNSCLLGTIFEGCGDTCVTEAPEEEKCSYGPCDCKPRYTLLQWSYGTSFAPTAPGPDEPLASDRPDFTENSAPVGRGVTQVEMGYTYTLDGDLPVHSYPEMLWRIGMLAEWFEARIGYNHGAQDVALSGQPATSDLVSDDIYLGIKLALTPQEGILPEMAITPQMNIAFANDNPALNGDVFPGVNWLYGWDLPGDIVASTAGSTQINKAIDDTGDEYYEFAQSWTIGYDFTERWHGYTEWYVLAPSAAVAARTQHYFNGGFTWLWSNNLQFDIRAGVGLSEASDDFFAGAGFVKRWN